MCGVDSGFSGAKENGVACLNYWYWKFPILIANDCGCGYNVLNNYIADYSYSSHSKSHAWLRRRQFWKILRDMRIHVKSWWVDRDTSTTAYVPTTYICICTIMSNLPSYEFWFYNLVICKKSIWPYSFTNQSTIYMIALSRWGAWNWTSP